jgi:hypothetical protein
MELRGVWRGKVVGAFMTRVMDVWPVPAVKLNRTPQVNHPRWEHCRVTAVEMKPRMGTDGHG